MRFPDDFHIRAPTTLTHEWLPREINAPRVLRNKKAALARISFRSSRISARGKNAAVRAPLPRAVANARRDEVVLTALSGLARNEFADASGNVHPRPRPPAGLNRTSKPLAKHAYRTEFHCSRKLVAATRTEALGLRHQGSSRPSAATRAENNTTLHRVVRNRPARLLAYSSSVA